MIKKLTKEQKKIIYISLVVLTFFFSFWIFVYGPQTRKFTSIKEELTQTEARTAEILSIAKGRDLAQAIRDLKINFIEVMGRFPGGEEMVIYNLSETAKKLKIEVKNIVPSTKQLLENKITGYDIEELPISLNLVSEFRSLGEYLNILRNNFPVLIRVRDLDIKGNGEGRALLEVALQISAYLSGQK